MSAEIVHRLQAALFNAPHGGAACDAIDKLRKAASKGSTPALFVLAEYAKRGAIGHMRTHAASQLASSIAAGDTQFAAPFERMLADPLTRYWATGGLLKSKGAGAYPTIVAIALDEGLPIADRANAVKRIAVHARQPFDRDLPTDPGHWKPGSLRLDEVRAWASGGYASGAGHPAPARHAGLDHPETDVDRLASRLDAVLARSRRDMDPANPHNVLVPASENALTEIRGRWDLPAGYLEFLAKFSPRRVTIRRDRFRNGLALYGADELVRRQAGYSHDSAGAPLEGWPAGYVVIADDGADPFVIDTSLRGERFSVLSAEHGMGTWDFAEEADCFESFLDELI